MSASYANVGPSELEGREARNRFNDRIYESLPPLGSAAYLNLLKRAPAAELPAPVLVRAYRQLHPSPAADATLERLLGHNERYGYLNALYAAARSRMASLDAFGADDLVCDTIGEIEATLAFAKGEGADRAWASYLHQCTEDAYRKLVGRRGERITKRAEAPSDGRRVRYDPIDAAGATTSPWHGSVAVSNLEWLEHFIEQTIAEIADENIRAVALDLFSHNPTPVSSDDPNDPETLAGRFRVTRFIIYRRFRAARAILRDALERQNEREIDMSFLTFANCPR